MTHWLAREPSGENVVAVLYTEADVARYRKWGCKVEGPYALADDLLRENEELRQRITVAEGYLTDPTVDRGERIQLAILALEDEPAFDEGRER
jgi:hypothetical protein